MHGRIRAALKQVQIERPAYASGAPDWWGEVIKRTALGAGADPARECTPRLYRPTDRRPSEGGSRPHHSAGPSKPSSSLHLRELITPLSSSSRGSVLGYDRAHIAYQVLLGTGLQVVRRCDANQYVSFIPVSFSRASLQTRFPANPI